MAPSRARRASDYQPTIWAAGVATYRMRKGRPEFLLVHRPRYDDWSLPKGKLDRGESFIACAEREVFEEAGVTGLIEDAIGTVGYITAAGNAKVVRYWLFHAKEETFRPNSEVDRIRWLRPARALERVSYTRDAAVLEAATSMAADRPAGKVLLVRHVDAGNKKKWKKADVVRPISIRGHEQMEALVTRLLRTPINRIVSSPMLRCEQTVGPLAQRLGMRVELSQRLKRGATPDDVMLLIKRSRRQRIVLCSHGETIGPLMRHLAGDPQVTVSGALEWPKGSLWELNTRNGRVVSARHIPRA